MSKSAVAAVEPESARPSSVKMSIHTGMLESLGINMYTSIGKSLVEFIANGFDAEASTVKLSIPFDDIEKARGELREQAKKEVENGKREDFTKIYETLPENIEIVIEDNGHGMTVEQLENKFLIVNRNRRKAEKSDKSENGLRTVMGRKGLGKLAGFGVAEQVIVRTKRKGETHSTTIAMDFDEIKKCEDIGDVTFETQYENGLNADSQGTKITLRKLRCDSLKSKEESIAETLSKNFYVTGDDFKISLNGGEIKDPEIDYEFVYPPADQLDEKGFGKHDVKVYEGFDYPILYNVRFRARAKEGMNDGKVRGHLPAHMRGARVYCNQRLAAGPTLFNLHTGMHNFHSQSYMECIVHADVLDRHETDLIGTNRSALKTDNEIVDAFVREVTELMRLALYEHSKHRDQVIKEEIEKDPVSRTVLDAVSQLAAKNREPAKKILTTIALSEGVDSEAYREVAPHLIKAINSSEVLIELIRTGTNPENLKTIIGQLTELAEVEKSDVLKLYRGRRHGIVGLQKLEERSHAAQQDGQYEDELQKLLKQNPWLIKPEYSNFLTSDAKMGEVARKLTAKLEIDYDAKNVDKSKDKRPDLVFVAVNPDTPTTISVIELKSPNVPLTNEHLSQLKAYMMDIEAIIQNDYQGQANVTGHLIGNMPRPDTQSRDGKLLLKEIKDAGTGTKWEVISIPLMLDRARKVHQSVIEALEAEEKEAEDDTDSKIE